MSFIKENDSVCVGKDAKTERHSCFVSEKSTVSRTAVQWELVARESTVVDNVLSILFEDDYDAFDCFKSRHYDRNKQRALALKSTEKVKHRETKI